MTEARVWVSLFSFCFWYLLFYHFMIRPSHRPTFASIVARNAARGESAADTWRIIYLPGTDMHSCHRVSGLYCRLSWDSYSRYLIIWRMCYRLVGETIDC